MRGLALRWLVVTFAIVCASYLIEGIRVSGFFSALFAAATLGVLNVFLRPLVLILTLPINVLTFGLFTFVINALMLKLASSVIPGFHVDGFWAAVFGALVISVVGWVLTAFIDDRESVGIIDLKKKDGDRWG